MGRSPRVRRSPALALGAHIDDGSISARAEEPRRCASALIAARVDLRACGGATAAGTWTFPAAGRSPRVRRSHHAMVFSGAPEGSISARAEEPRVQHRLQVARRVDLRACGGASLTSQAEALQTGRSPRGRRSLRSRTVLTAGARSISARAEEPPSPVSGRRGCRVDLRACGGAITRSQHAGNAMGRSPRVRRSHFLADKDATDLGSISARAEEPLSRWNGQLTRRVASAAPRSATPSGIRCSGTRGAAAGPCAARIDYFRRGPHCGFGAARTDRLYPRSRRRPGWRVDHHKTGTPPGGYEVW